MISQRIRKLWDGVLVAQRRKETLLRLKQNTLSNHLSKEQASAARTYFAGCGKIDLRSHNFYYEKTGIFCENYLPEDLHYCSIDPFYNNWREAVYVDNKCLYPRMFTGVCQPDMLAIRCNGMWFVDDYVPISREALGSRLSSEPELVVKMAMGSEGGRGVFFVAGSELSSAEKRIRDDIVIQRPVVQHSLLSAINPSSVNTIRMISLLSDEGVKVYSTILRIGVGKSRVDNASSGGITCGVSPEGRLRKYAYKANGERYEQHPDTAVVFENYPIPGYQKCLAAVQKLHPQIPHFRLVSWDFSVDEAGEPILIEANLKYGQLDFHQLNNGPLFGEDTPKILREVFGASSKG